MSGHLYRTPKSAALKKETKANFAWRSVSSDEATSRIREHFNAEVKDPYEYDKGSEDWRILLDDSDDSILGWGQNSSSSSASWLDDLENEATNRLQIQLDVLDKLVFGEDLTAEEATIHVPNDLLEEATLWRTSYPHLRVKGVSLPLPAPVSEIDNVEEVIASHSIAVDFEKQTNESLNPICASVSPKGDDVSGNLKIFDKLSADLKADVMKRLFDHLWPDVLDCVKSKVLSYSQDNFNTVKDVETLPFVTGQQRVTSTTGLQKYQPLAHDSKFSSHSLDIPERYICRSSNQTARGSTALDSILKVSPLPVKRSGARRVPSQVVQTSYHILSSRGQTHLISNRNNHLTLPPIEVPAEPSRGNNFEGSFSHLRSTSALPRDHHQLSCSRPNTSTLISAQESNSKPSFISVSSSNLSKNLSFNVLGKHLPANSNLQWYKSSQKKINSVLR